MSFYTKKWVFANLLIIVLLLPIFSYNIGWNFDDTGYWLNTFKNNELSLKYFNNDRFAPFNTISTKLLSMLSFKPNIFFIYNYFLAFFSISILFYMTLKLNLKTWIFPIIIILTASFSTTFYRVFHGERELLFLWTLFIFIIFKSINFKYNFELSSLIYLIIIPVNIALYYKETSVVLLSVSIFTAFCFIWHYNNKYFALSKKVTKTLRNLFIILIANIFIYIWLYVTHTYPIKSDSYYNDLVPYTSMIERVKYSFNSIFLYLTTDFLIFGFLPIIFLYVNYYIFDRVGNFNFSTKLLFANFLFIISFLFILSHILLGIHSNYYLLPVYPFAILSFVLYFDLILSFTFFKNKIVLFLVFLITIFNSINSSINEVIFLRISSKNFMQYQLHLNDLLIDRNNSNKSENSILFLGVNDFSYLSNIQTNFFEFYNIPILNLSFISIHDLKIKDKINSKSKIYFILTPNTNEKRIDLKSKIRTLKLKKNFGTNSKNYHELPELRHIVKYFILKFSNNSIQSPNIYREVDYEIYTY
jgi:hypothetical protein